MSHFQVAVFHKPEQSIENMLAPYSESDEKYYVADPMTEDEIAEAKRGYTAKHNLFGSFDDYMRQMHGAKLIDGAWCRWYNPEARWDWWQTGGRWSGEVSTLDGEETDEDFVKNIDWTRDDDVYRHAIRFWEVYVDGKPLQEDEEEGDYDSIFKKEYYLERYGTAKQYATLSSSKSPYAYVSSDGKWHAPGTMGWFACDDATAETMIAYENEFTAYIATHPDEVVTMVDCHI